MKCKTCQHAIKLHKHPLNRMFNGAISEQVDFIGCIALGKDNGVIVDRAVVECEGYIQKRKEFKLLPKLDIRFLKTLMCSHEFENSKVWTFNCGIKFCKECVFRSGITCYKLQYNFEDMYLHDFDKTEVTIKDLEQFKIK